MKNIKIFTLITVIAMVISLFGGMVFADESTGAQSSTTIDPLTAQLPSTDDIKPVDTTLVLPTEPNEQSTEAPDPNINSTIPVGKAGSNDPLRQTLKDKITQLNTLRAQEKQIRETLKSQTQANVTLIKNIRGSLTGLAKQNSAKFKDQITALKSQIQALRDQIKTLQEQLKGLKNTTTTNPAANLQEQLKTLNSQLQAAKKNKDTDGVASIQAQIKAIRDQIASAKVNPNKDAIAKIQAQIKDLTQQIKDKMASIKTLSVANKTDSTNIKALRDTITKGFADIKPLWDSEKALFTDIKTINTNKQAEWKLYDQAISAKDLASANTHMDNIMKFKQQIISKLTDVGNIKTQVNQKLTALAASIQIK